VSEIRRLAQDPAFLGLFEEGGAVYRAMEAEERHALNPQAPIEAVRVRQGRLQGMKLVRDLVIAAARAESPDEISEDTFETMPRLMRVVQGGT
jgi:hypothetical protein